MKTYRLILIDRGTMSEVPSQEKVVAVVATTPQHLVVQEPGRSGIEVALHRRSGLEVGHGGMAKFWQLPDEDLWDVTTDVGRREVEDRRLCADGVGVDQKVVQGSYGRGAYSPKGVGRARANGRSASTSTRGPRGRV